MHAEKYWDDRECRAFDLQRYGASFCLEALVRTLETRKCYFAKNENFVTIENAGAPAGHEYRVFFTIRADRIHADTVTLIVQSAYFRRKDGWRGDLQRKPVRFGVILSNTLSGRPLREPP
jgi:hypothetical protein